MAAGITETDSFGEVRSGGERAWHGLGQELPSGLCAEEAFREIGLDWGTKLMEVSYDSPIGPQIVKGYRAHVREDNNYCLGIVRNGYTPIENIEIAQFADSLAGQDQAVNVETAGSLFGGRRIFVLVNLPSTIVVDNDEVKKYVVVTSGHGGSASFAAYLTSVRVVCANTLSYSEKDSATGFRIYHTVNAQSRMRMASAILDNAHKAGERFDACLRKLGTAKWNRATMAEYFDRAYGVVVPTWKNKEEHEKRGTTRKANVIKTWAQLLDEEVEKMPSIEDTAWSGLNAITQWLDHVQGRSEKFSDTRIENNVFGTVAARKTNLLQHTLALV